MGLMDWRGEHADVGPPSLTLGMWALVSDYGIVRDGNGDIVMVGPKYVFPEPFPGFFDQIDRKEEANEQGSNQGTSR